MNQQFPESAPAANPVFFRTYSRQTPDSRETWEQVCRRTVAGLAKLGRLTSAQTELIHRMQSELKCLTSGRWLWIGGTKWIEQPENFPGAYNCSSTNITDWNSFGLLMDLAMMGVGTGAVIEEKYINCLPAIHNKINVTVTGEIGSVSPDKRQQNSTLQFDSNSDSALIVVGDSRKGWVRSYQTLLELSSNWLSSEKEIDLTFDLSNIRPAGEKLNGFGGVANPIKLPELYTRCAAILNGAVGRKLNSIECCLLIDEAAVVVVAGNVRRSAGIRQGGSDDKLFTDAKANLWQQDNDGNWRIDPSRDALRMANHSRVFHRKPSLDECIEAVRKQYYSGEGAIQWAGEAVARANADLLDTQEKKQQFLKYYADPFKSASSYLEYLIGQKGKEIYASVDSFIDYRMNIYGLNPCGEIVLQNNFCNLSEAHLNRINPGDFKEQEDAFRAGAIAVAALLNHRFIEERYQKSRGVDPIVGVSFTGLFDFFVNAFGVDWLRWWEAGRPSTEQGQGFKQQEAGFLARWREIVRDTVWEYCDQHGLKRPNRYTTVQPAGTKSLLTGASPGWHPPKAQRFIRRITFRKNDPVALACIDYGYTVIPSQSDKNGEGRLLDDPFSDLCTEWLVEIPVAVPWADLPGADKIDVSKFSALAQMDFYLNIQTNYTTHNTSSTIELRAHEIEALGERIYQAIQSDEGYISSALLARFDDYQAFPRLPFEPINLDEYNRLVEGVKGRRKIEDFHLALMRHDQGEASEPGPAGCDSDKCLMPEKRP